MPPCSVLSASHRHGKAASSARQSPWWAGQCWRGAGSSAQGERGRAGTPGTGVSWGRAQRCEGLSRNLRKKLSEARQRGRVGAEAEPCWPLTLPLLWGPGQSSPFCKLPRWWQAEVVRCWTIPPVCQNWLGRGPCPQAWKPLALGLPLVLGQAPPHVGSGCLRPDLTLCPRPGHPTLHPYSCALCPWHPTSSAHPLKIAWQIPLIPQGPPLSPSLGAGSGLGSPFETTRSEGHLVPHVSGPPSSPGPGAP